jgi:hypothetical protein
MTRPMHTAPAEPQGPKASLTTSPFPVGIDSPRDVGSVRQAARADDAVAYALQFIGGRRETEPVAVERLPAADSS